MGVSVFICGQPGGRCEIPGCGDRAAGGCGYQLGGRKAGEVCGMRVCARHAFQDGAGGPRLCQSHARLIARQKQAADNTGKGAA